MGGFFLFVGIVHRTGYTHQISAVSAGSVEMPPSYVIVLKGCHNVEDGTPTGARVDGS